MTTATRSVAVVATRLPNIDRRALSQAWYSALHVPQAQPGMPPPVRAAAVSNAAAKNHGFAPGGRSATLAARGAAPAAVRTHTLSSPAPVSGDRRGPVSELSRRIETALLRHGAAAPSKPATLAIKAGDGRVQLLVRNDGSATRVVALCAPHLRECVDRALAHARFALAANGTLIEALRR